MEEFLVAMAAELEKLFPAPFDPRPAPAYVGEPLPYTTTGSAVLAERRREWSAHEEARSIARRLRALAEALGAQRPEG